MAELNSAYGAKPSQLPDAVPQKNAFDDILGSTPAPDMPAAQDAGQQATPVQPQAATPAAAAQPAQPPPPLTPDAFSDILGNPNSLQPNAAVKLNQDLNTPPIQFVKQQAETLKAEHDKMVKDNPDVDFSTLPTLKQQYDEAKQHIAASFAATKQETKQLLEKNYGAQNVKYVGDKAFVKRPGDNKFTEFNSGLINLALSGISRPAVETAVQQIGEGLGTAAGTLTTPVTGPVGPTAGFVAGRAAGTYLGLKASDAIASAFGIEHDPQRNMLLEHSIAQAFQTVLPGIAHFADLSAERRILSKAAGVSEADLLTKENQAIYQNSQNLRDSGLIQNIPNTDTPITLYQVNPDNPYARAQAEQLMSDPAIVKAMIAQSESYGEAVPRVLRAAADVTGKENVPTEALPSVVKNIASDLRSAEGEAIGKYKLAAQRTLKGQPVALPDDLKQTAQKIMDGLGFRTEAGAVNPVSGQPGPTNFVKPSVDEITGALGLKNTAAGRNMLNLMGDFQKSVSKGNMTLDELGRTITAFSNKNIVRSVESAGGAGSAYYYRMLSQLRDFQRQAISSGLSDADKIGFNSSMDKFGKVLGAQNDLARSLDDELSSRIFLRKLFSKEDGSLGAIQAAKSLLADEHPDTWGRIKGQWLEQMQDKYVNSGSKTGINSAGLLKEFNSYGPETLKEVFGGDVNQVRNFLALGARIEGADLSRLPSDAVRGNVQKLVGFFSGFRSAKINAAIWMSRMFKGNNSVIAQQMTKDGIDTYLKYVPNPQRGVMMQSLNDYLNYVKNNKLAGALDQFRNNAARQGLQYRGSSIQPPPPPEQ